MSLLVYERFSRHGICFVILRQTSRSTMYMAGNLALPFFGKYFVGFTMSGCNSPTAHLSE